MKTRFSVEAHIPRGSGDAEYHIVTDDGVIVALVDPQMSFDDAGELADKIAAAMNVNPESIL